MMVGVAHIEIERTYAPPAGAVVPDLSVLTGVADAAEPDQVLLVAEYYDTADLDLTRAGVSLRRRAGGADEGWHLKLPARVGRLEVHLPLGSATGSPPAELGRIVLGWTRRATLEPVATIETRRTTRSLRSAEGTVLAELADDEVVGTRADGGRESWREWELELVTGDGDLLDAAEALFAGVGAAPAANSRKIARVLGDRVPPAVRRRRPKPGKPVARLAHAYLAAQVDDLARRDVEVRRGEPGGIHHARIACRRLRSALATFRPVLDRERTDPVRDEIRWLATTLGDARDATVVGQRLGALLADEPPELVDDAVGRRVEATYGGRPEVPASLLSDRYLDLRRVLDDLVADPPWTEEAARPAREVVTRLVRKDWKRLRRRWAAAAEAEDLDVALHQVRKAAKRLRYAAEAVQPVAGKKAKRLGAAAKGLTAHLGERQDTVATRVHLRRLADAAAAGGEPTFAYGRLHAREQGRAAELDARNASVWNRLSAPARRWTC